MSDYQGSSARFQNFAESSQLSYPVYQAGYEGNADLIFNSDRA
jgi:hypothetical protein